MHSVKQHLRNARLATGQGLVEYALILALIAVVAILAINFIGAGVSTTLSKVEASI